MREQAKNPTLSQDQMKEVQLQLAREPPQQVQAAVCQLNQRSSKAERDQLMGLTKQAWEAGDAILKGPAPAAAAAGSSSQGASLTPAHEVRLINSRTVITRLQGI